MFTLFVTQNKWFKIDLIVTQLDWDLCLLQYNDSQIKVRLVEEQFGNCLHFDTSKFPSHLDFKAVLFLGDSQIEMSRSNPISQPIGNSYNLCINVKIFTIGEPGHRFESGSLNYFLTHPARVALVADDGEFWATKELLVARSSVFRTMFDPIKNSQEFQNSRIVFKGTNMKVLHEFVLFLDTDHVNEKTEFAFDLLQLAIEFKLPLLREKSIQVIIDNVTNANVEVVFHLLHQRFPEVLLQLFKSSYKEMQSTPNVEPKPQNWNNM